MTNNKIYELLLNKIPNENILKNESMKKHTSFKIGGNADFFVKAKNVEEIKFILDICKRIVLKIDIDYFEVNKIIQHNNLNSTMLKVNPEADVLVTVSAGVPLGKLAQILLKQSISGFEFAAGIPGTIGGAVRMNAGAYGSEFKDIVLETTCINPDGKIFKLGNDEQKFEYRKSIFKESKYIILETKLLLKQLNDNTTIKEKMDEFRKSRMEKQPIEFPSAGSTFKRGDDFITAKLIDECGLKGYTIGEAQVSSKHAGFLINTGNATAEDVLELVDTVKKKVLEKFNKEIELEIEVVGE